MSQLTVVTFSQYEDDPVPGLIDEDRIVRLRASNQRGLTTITTTVALVWFLLRRGLGYSIWHCHAPTPAVAVATAIGSLFGIPVIVKLPSSPRDGRYEAFSKGLLGRLGLLLPLIRRAHSILTMTEVGLMEARRLGFSPQKLRMIPNGVDVDVFRPVALAEKVKLRVQLGLPPSGLVVLAAGRLEWEKDLATLLNAWSRCVQRDSNPAFLAIIGSGSQHQELEVMSKVLGIDGQVCFFGEQRNVADWYRAADIYVLPSRREGLSNSLLEAMASGLPVVMTHVSGSDIVSQKPPAGYVVPVGDAPLLGEMLSELVADDCARETMGENARIRIVESFSLDSVRQKVLALYEELVSQQAERLNSDD